MRILALKALGAAAVAAAVTSAGAAIAPAAAVPAMSLAGTETSAAPYAVEDFTYPGAAQILQDQGITLKRGNGGLVLIACDKPWDVMVESRVSGGRNFCFDALRPDGYLSMEISDAFGIWTEDVAVQAKLTADGNTTTVNVAKDSVRPVGESDLPSGGKRSVLAELRVTNGPAPAAPAADPSLAFTGTLDIGSGERSCTAVLVDPRWVATAKSCFGTEAAAGAPKQPVKATVGSKTYNVTELAPRTDRDLILLRLDQLVTDATPAKLASAAPAADAPVTAAGYGRTKTEWVPGKVHTASFKASASAATTLTLDAAGQGNVICQGDAGGPVLNASGELVGINSKSWQGGCLGTDPAETRTGAIAVRTDDLGGWIQETARRSVQRDVNGDGRSDAVMVYHHANTSIAFYSSLAKADGGFNEFTAGYTVPANSWDRNAMKLITGDFNGDGRADMGMMYRNADSSIKMYTGLANTAGLIQPFTSSYTVPASAGWDWNAIQLHSGDVNGDGRSDAVMVYHHANTSIAFYSSLAKADGGFNEFTAGYTVPANSWDRNAMKLITGDFNGDGRADMGMMYRNADSSIKMYTGLANTAGLIQPFTSSYTVPASAGWDWNAIQLHSGDVNGDGRSDAVMVYHHANTSIAFYSSLAKADGGFNEFTAGYTVPANSWDRNAMKLITGDFNGDGRADMGMMYRNADSSIKMYTGLANTAGLIQPFTSSYTVPANSWDWNAIQLP